MKSKWTKASLSTTMPGHPYCQAGPRTLFSTCPVVLGLDGVRVTRSASSCPGSALTSALVCCLFLTTVTGGRGGSVQVALYGPSPWVALNCGSPSCLDYLITEFQSLRVSGILYFIKMYTCPEVSLSPRASPIASWCVRTPKSRAAVGPASVTPPLHVTDFPLLQTHTWECYSWHSF